MSPNVISKEITDLQIRITHQDDTLDQLNDVILHQQKMIDHLTAEFEIFKQRLISMADSNLAPPEEDAAPPHY